MAVRALKPWSVGAPRIHGVGNIDGTALGDLLTELNPRTTLFVVVSKTFTTEETLSKAQGAGTAVVT
jgi:glucose-6-phosphate isomerase